MPKNRVLQTKLHMNSNLCVLEIQASGKLQNNQNPIFHVIAFMRFQEE